MSTPSVTLEVASRFDELRRKYLVTRLTIAVAAVMALAMCAWLTLAAIDFFQEWALVWRQLALALAATILGGWFLSRIVLINRDARPAGFASLLERSFDGFGQRIRTVLDTVDGRVSGPDEMLTALGHQTMGRWETLSPEQVVPVRGLWTAIGICLMCVLTAGGLYAVDGDINIAMNRALGQRLTYTQMEVTPGHSKILEGLPVLVKLELIGRSNRDVVMRHRVVSASAGANTPETQQTQHDWIETELLPVTPSDEAPENLRQATFETELGKALEPVEYQFVTTAGSSEIYRIDVHPLIELRNLATVVEPPAYTKLEQRRFSTRNVNVLQGSTVTVTVESSHPLTTAQLQVGPKPSRLETVDLQPGDDPAQWTFNLPTSGSVHWRFSGEGEDGTPMDPVKGRLQIRRDRKPAVKWRDPEDALMVHTLAEIPMRLQVADDYGIAETAIVFQLGDVEEFVLTDWVSTTDTGNDLTRTSLSLERTLPLESFALTERDFISYYAYAIDNRDGRPQRTETDIRYIDIRPLRQFYGEREGQPGNGGAGGPGSLRVSLGELIQRERFLINRTRRLVRGGSSQMAKKLGTIDQMVEAQSELAALVRFLTEFLVEQGNDDVEALNQAEAAMLQATDSLSLANFELALIQENDALRALSEARRTLDTFLTRNMTASERQQTAAFLRRLRQRLRRQVPETERELADTLRRIAIEQLKLGDEANQMLAEREDAETDSQAAEMPADEPETPTEDLGTDSEESVSAAEKIEEFQARQLGLVERIQVIEEQLADRLADSAVMSRRMDAAKDGMNRLTTMARELELSEFDSQSEAVADQLVELGIQLGAVQATAPLEHISAVRDLTDSLAGLEYSLGDKMRQAFNKANATDDSRTLRRSAKRVEERTETIEDVLKLAAPLGDLEASEAYDLLAQFVEDTRFLEQLATSRQAAQVVQQDITQPLTSPAIDDTHARALAYAEAAEQLNELFQQLVAPMLARLRELEQQANELADQMENGNAGPPEEDPTTQAALAELESELQALGMRDVAQLLDTDAVSDQQIQDMLQQMNFQGVNTVPGQSTTQGRVRLIVAALRGRIQEAILIDVSADRDASVPTQYRGLVDGYFRTLAGEEDLPASGGEQ